VLRWADGLGDRDPGLKFDADWPDPWRNLDGVPSRDGEVDVGDGSGGGSGGGVVDDGADDGGGGGDGGGVGGRGSPFDSASFNSLFRALVLAAFFFCASVQTLFPGLRRGVEDDVADEMLSSGGALPASLSLE